MKPIKEGVKDAIVLPTIDKIVEKQMSLEKKISNLGIEIDKNKDNIITDDEKLAAYKEAALKVSTDAASNLVAGNKKEAKENFMLLLSIILFGVGGYGLKQILQRVFQIKELKMENSILKNGGTPKPPS